ncbi:MAG: exopolyphosphatase, partial [Verrucomicrobia bacterium]|nr:exopolyphosphatase [Verrucomicrobiota bacterium]
LFGLGAKDLELAAIVARYHRRAIPRPTHEFYALLDRFDRIAVSKLAAILRVADALNRGQERRLREIEIQVEPKRLTITARNVADATLEQMALSKKANLFERVYGMEVILRTDKV